MITFDTCVCVCVCVSTGLFKGHGGIELASHSMKETSCSAGDSAERFCTETPTSVAAAMLSLLLWPWTEFKIECPQKPGSTLHWVVTRRGKMGLCITQPDGHYNCFTRAYKPYN